MTKRTRALGFAVAVLSVAVLLLDSYAYHFSGWFTCLSDDLSVIEGGLREYEKSHAGQIPATFDEFRLFWNSTNREFPLDTYWRKVHGGFVWNSGLKTPEGSPVIVMCPVNSHGLLRKFAWGLANVAGDIRYVRVESGAVVPYKW